MLGVHKNNMDKETKTYLIKVPVDQIRKFNQFVEDAPAYGLKIKINKQPPRYSKILHWRAIPKEFIDEYCREHNLEFETDLLTHRRNSSFVIKRCNFIAACLKKGYGYSSIGRCLDRDHSTIIHLTKKYRL